jgi:hypothetical protein
MRLFTATIALSAFLVMPAIVVQSDPAHAVTINLKRGSGASLNSGRPVQCGDGVELLRGRGFRDVRAVGCHGRNFVYLGWRGGAQYEVVVRARDARILTTRRIRQ